MSVSQCVYFGAYLEVQLKSEKETHYTYECRYHPEQKYTEYVKFCSVCGKKMRRVRHIVDKYSSYEDIMGDSSNLRSIENISPDYKLIVVSDRNGDGTNISIDTGDEGVYDVLDHNDYITKFYKNYVTEVSKLNSNDHVVSVVYKCGMIVYWN